MPTIINLFGLEDSHCYIGSDVLDDNYTGFAYFGNSAWIDNEMYYSPDNQPTDPGLAETINAGNQKVNNAFNINDIVIIGDYFAHRK